MNKGFTLIELLAVIVILAIIALIATPIVLSIINDSKESAVLRSAEFYANAVENKIMQENMKQGGTLDPKQCIINEDGNVDCDGTPLEIEVNGEKPTSGNITFDKGKVIDVNLTFGDKTVSMNSSGELVYNPACILISGKANEIGSKYKCKVKDDMETSFESGYNFFVLSHNEDGTTNLIMERNICDDGTVATEGNKCHVAWYKTRDNRYGPVDAFNYLHNATKDWDNIPNMIMDYRDENVFSSGTTGAGGYFGIVTEGSKTKITKKDGTVTLTIEEPLKARLPMYIELSSLDCTTASNSCPLFVSNYLETPSGFDVPTEKVSISGIIGYWTMSSYGDNIYSAWDVYQRFHVANNYIDRTTTFGVRPVITIKL